MVSGRLPSWGVSRFCRHNRLLAECPICSKGTILDPARPVERRPRSRSGGGTGTPASRAARASRAFRGPYAAAGPYEGGTEVRMEQVPGGLRLAEWQGGEIARKAPVVDAAHLPRLLAEAADKNLLTVSERAEDGSPAPEGTYGSSPGRTGDFLDELRVERVDGDRVRIARWIRRPNAGWQLQEAPVMLPQERFEQALASAAARGVPVHGDAGVA
jgi:hypothetical protein